PHRPVSTAMGAAQQAQRNRGAANRWVHATQIGCDGQPPHTSHIEGSQSACSESGKRIAPIYWRAACCEATPLAVCGSTTLDRIHRRVGSRANCSLDAPLV